MKSLIELPILSLFLFVFVNNSFGQDNYASNIQTTISDEQKLFINYDIIVNDGSKYFNVIVQLIYEGKTITPNPNNIYGNFGHAMTPGNKIIYWNYSSDFSGDINKVEVKVLANRENEPLAKFLSSSTNGKLYAPCEMKFTDKSEHCDKYEWDFGDVNSGIENNSFEQNPTHTFKKGGSYKIALTGYNTNLNLKSTFYETIVVKEYEPTVADFKIIGFENLKKQSVPITIEFKNLSSANADSFSWDFGDPNSGRKKNTSTESDPSHRYKNPGQYQIGLTAKSSFSGLSATKTMEIVLPGKPAKEAAEPTKNTLSDYDKQKKMKTIWLASTITTAGVGGILLLKSNSLKNDYKTATDDAESIREQYKTLGTVFPIFFAAAIFSGVQTAIHAKKQSSAKTQLSFQVSPDNRMVWLSLLIIFKLG
jgi:PKD repeat protein